jgi:hypothetical protein
MWQPINKRRWFKSTNDLRPLNGKHIYADFITGDGRPFEGTGEIWVITHGDPDVYAVELVFTEHVDAYVRNQIKFLLSETQAQRIVPNTDKTMNCEFLFTGRLEAERFDRGL